MEEKRDFRVDISIIAILLFFSASFAGSTESPGMQVIIEYWTARGVSVTSVRMMSSIMSIVSLPLTLTVGTFVGKRVKYRTVAITAVAFIIVGSISPFFIHPNWGTVLALRALVGIGVGLAGCRTSLLLSSVPVERRTQFMGMGQACSIGIGVVSGPIVGMLSNISWRHIFLINLYTIPVFLFMFFIKEPPKAEPKAISTEGSTGRKFSPVMLKYAAFQLAACSCSIFIIQGISTYLKGHAIGNATLAGTVLIAYSVGTVVVSSIGKVQKVLKRFTMPFCYALVVCGYLLLVSFPNVVTAFAGAFLLGFGYMGSFSLMQVFNGNSVSREQIPLASSILLTGNQLGMFLCPILMKVADGFFHLTTDADSAFLLGAFVFAGMAILSLIPGLIVPKQAEAQTR